MQVQVVADIGNSRIKWGRCTSTGIDAFAAVPSDDPAAWRRQAEAWNLGRSAWAVGGVQPHTRARFVRWLADEGHAALVLDSYRKLPLEVAVEAPERVGLDRLFDALAARSRVAPKRAAIVVDAGSAVTVDWVDEAGAFRGGAILPGLRLMARALKEHTAQLPLVEVTRVPMPPATSTVAAIETGIAHAVLGGVALLVRNLGRLHSEHDVFLTGGDGPLLGRALEVPHVLWPEMTLEGMRLTAEADV